MQNSIPVVETLSAGVAGWRNARVSSSAFVAVSSSDSRFANASSVARIALLAHRTLHVALARVTLRIRVAPRVDLALVAFLPAVTRPTSALSVELVALLLEGTMRVAIASDATGTACDLPVVLHALVAFLADNVRKTRALSHFAVTRAAVGVGAEQVAHALRALVLDGVSEEIRLASLAVEALGVEEALQTFSRPRIAIPLHRLIRVVIAVAVLAHSSHRASEVVGRTQIAPVA